MHIIGYALLCFFCLYGFMQLFLHFVSLFYEYRELRDKKVYTVVFVQNEENTVEGMVRSLLWRNMHREVGDADSAILVIDTGSTDNTAEIVRKMEQDYPLIHLCTPEEFLDGMEKL